jgi:hypothetical protein
VDVCTCLQDTREAHLNLNVFSLVALQILRVTNFILVFVIDGIFKLVFV